MHPASQPTYLPQGLRLPYFMTFTSSAVPSIILKNIRDIIFILIGQTFANNKDSANECAAYQRINQTVGSGKI